MGKGGAKIRGVDAPGNSEHNVSEGEKDSSTSQSQNSNAVESSSSDSARDSSSSEASSAVSSDGHRKCMSTGVPIFKVHMY